jgi:hypothetical protein
MIASTTASTLRSVVSSQSPRPVKPQVIAGERHFERGSEYHQSDWFVGQQTQVHLQPLGSGDDIVDHHGEVLGPERGRQQALVAYAELDLPLGLLAAFGDRGSVAAHD